MREVRSQENDDPVCLHRTAELKTPFRIFPAVDILKSGTRRDDLLLTREESECVDIIHKATSSLKPEEAVEKILDLFARTRTNREFVEMAKKIRFF